MILTMGEVRLIGRYKTEVERTVELDIPQVGHVQQDNPEVTEPIDNQWPEGTAYHINSRRLKTRQIRRIAAALGVTVGSASADDTRTIVEGKLREMDKNPTEAQVTVQCSDDDSGTLFLINDEGVILTVEAVIDSHVTGDEMRVRAVHCEANTCRALPAQNPVN